MLEAVHNLGSSFPRLCMLQRVDQTWIEAWIVHKTPDRVGGIDWELWVKRNGAFSRSKCQLRLAVESRLRSWLLRECGMPLNTLTYIELRLIAEGKRQEARRIHARGIDTLTHRFETPPIPHISAA
jgi:hypothetical protein